MWWKQELEQRRRDVIEARRRLNATRDASPASSQATPISNYLPAMIAAGFATGALLGPRRALKVATLAVSGFKMAKAVTQMVSESPPDRPGTHTSSTGRGATSRTDRNGISRREQVAS